MYVAKSCHGAGKSWGKAHAFEPPASGSARAACAEPIYKWWTEI